MLRWIKLALAVLVIVLSVLGHLSANIWVPLLAKLL